MYSFRVKIYLINLKDIQILGEFKLYHLFNEEIYNFYKLLMKMTLNLVQNRNKLVINYYRKSKFIDNVQKVFNFDCNS